MQYDAFFRAFYIGESNGCLKGYTTTWAIPKFFAESILRTDESRAKLPTDDMSYDKWFQGNASPRNHWANFAKNYKEELLVSDLMDTLDDKNLRKLLDNFAVKDDGEEINKLLLCTAIAQQFKEIIDGKGTGKDVFADIYLSGNIRAEFTEYINKAVARYNVMKLIGGDEVPLEKFYVSNTIGEKERVFADKKRIKCLYLDDPTLQKIRNIYLERRGYDNLRTVLIGSGGCGKSLMLQNLFIKAAKEYKKTGILPVFLELRYFKQSDDLLSFITNTVHDKEPQFTQDTAHRLLLSGRCQLLLDGFDEIDPSDIDRFLIKLEQFTDKYDKVQIVISSRENESLTGLHNFVKLYMWPFDTKQSEQLIDKILVYRGETEEKETVLEYINNGFLKKDGVFASHPLLLTFVTIEYPKYKRFNGNHLLFYKATYEALLSGHDDNKKPYDRVFMSVDNAVQFSTVFKEFCAITYKEGALEFDTSKFEEYFNKLKSYQGFKNPYKMNVKNFKHDVCSTACMMYEKEYDIFYIDPGFQEYLFAEYYTQAELDEIKDLLEDLKILPYSKILRFDALDMFYERAEVKVKEYILLPLLNDIFKGSNEESFILFLEKCFDEIDICVHDRELEINYKSSHGDKQIYYPEVENHARTILLNFVLKLMGNNVDYSFPLHASSAASLPAESEITGKLIGQEHYADGMPNLIIDCKPIEYYDMIRITHKNGYEHVWLTDENKDLVCFGSRYRIDGYDLCQESEKYQGLLIDAIKYSPETYDVFLRIKAYHKALLKEQHRHGRR